MLRLQPTTITLTGEDIFLAMHHLDASKTNTAEASVSSLDTSVAANASVTKQRRRNKDLEALLADAEDLDLIDKTSRLNLPTDEFGGVFELPGPSRSDPRADADRAVGREFDCTVGTVGIARRVGATMGSIEDASRNGFSRSLFMMHNLELDGIPLSLIEGTDQPRRNDPVELSDEDADYLFSSDVRSDASTPILSTSSISNSAEGLSLGSATTAMSGNAGVRMAPEYSITSTFLEFGGPSEPFSLLSIHDDQRSPIFTPAFPDEAPNVVDIRTESGLNNIHDLSQLSGSEILLHSFGRRRGISVVYNNAAADNLLASMAFSPFTYSPDDQENSIDLIPEITSAEDDDSGEGENTSGT